MSTILNVFFLAKKNQEILKFGKLGNYLKSIFWKAFIFVKGIFNKIVGRKIPTIIWNKLSEII